MTDYQTAIKSIDKPELTNLLVFDGMNPKVLAKILENITVYITRTKQNGMGRREEG